MTEPKETLFRTVPRQERSGKRIGLILDTAAVLFEEMGYDATTTKHVAERAGIAVGSVYHWFPDKATLANALAERYLEQLLKVYAAELIDDPDEHTYQLVQRFVRVLAEFALDHPTFATLFVSSFDPRVPDSPGGRLRDGLHRQVATLVELRAEGTDPIMAEVVTTTVVTIFHALLASASRSQGPQRTLHIEELTHVLVAYLAARFPSSSDPIWNEIDPVIPPLARARTTADGHVVFSASPKHAD